MTIYQKNWSFDLKDFDRNGHVNNQVYLEWMNRLAIAHSESIGLGFDACLSQGVYWVARQHTMTYYGAVYKSEPLIVRTWVSELTKIGCRRLYEIERQEEGNNLVFKGATYWVLVSAETGKPVKPPTIISKRLQEALVC